MGRAPGWTGREWYGNDDPGDEVRKLRDDMDHLPGLLAAQRRLVSHGMKVYPAFDSLDIFDRIAAADYIADQLAAIKVPKEQRGRMLGLVLAFGITCVEADRELHREADP